MQAQMQEKLGTIIVTSEAGDGAIIIIMSADMEVKNVKLDKSKLDLSDMEQVEDLMVVAMNKAIVMAQTKAAAETQKMMSDILPGGMGAFGGLFGK